MNASDIPSILGGIGQLAESGGPALALAVVCLGAMLAVTWSGFSWLKKRLEKTETSLSKAAAQERQWLNGQLEEQNQEIKRLKNALDSRARENVELSRIVSEVRSDVASLKAENESLRVHRSNLQEQLKGCEEARQSQNSELYKLRSEVSLLRRITSDLEAENAKLKTRDSS